MTLRPEMTSTVSKIPLGPRRGRLALLKAAPRTVAAFAVRNAPAHVGIDSEGAAHASTEAAQQGEPSKRGNKERQ